MIERMRAPLDPEDSVGLSNDDDDDTSTDENEKRDGIPGAFPDRSVTNSSTGSYY